MCLSGVPLSLLSAGIPPARENGVSDALDEGDRSALGADQGAESGRGHAGKGGGVLIDGMEQRNDDPRNPYAAEKLFEVRHDFETFCGFGEEPFTTQYGRRDAQTSLGKLHQVIATDELHFVEPR